MRKAPVAVGAATAVWIAGSSAQAATHTVRAGDTLASIAKRYGTTVQELAKANHLSNPNLITTGQTLHLPSSARVTSVHVVSSGETLSSLAHRYGTTVQRLARMNHLSDPNVIIAGTHIKVPSAAQTSSSSGSSVASSSDHVVESGETLSSIASRYGVSVQALIAANHLTNPNLIVAGTRLAIPGGASAGSSSPSVGETLRSTAASVGVDQTLVEAVAWQESGWNQAAVSVTGARGVMQLTRGTTDYVNAVLGGGDLSRRHMTDNIRLGTLYLHHLLGMFPERKALAAYFSGPGNVHHRLDRSQRHYVNAVEAIQTRL